MAPHAAVGSSPIGRIFLMPNGCFLSENRHRQGQPVWGTCWGPSAPGELVSIPYSKAYRSVHKCQLLHFHVGHHSAFTHPSSGVHDAATIRSMFLHSTKQTEHKIQAHCIRIVEAGNHVERLHGTNVALLASSSGMQLSSEVVSDSTWVVRSCA